MDYGPDPVRDALGEVLAALSRGEPVRERSVVDFKEEAGRRLGAGLLGPSQPRNEKAAAHLAGEVACMANTPGGGGLVVGVAKDGSLIGTDMEAEWLRARLYERLDRRVTVESRSVEVTGTRLVVLIVPEAIEPISHQGKLRWRVDDRCVEIDPTTWRLRQAELLHVDWSAQPSGLAAEAVRPGAIGQVREYLREAVERSANELAQAADGDLLRRLNAVTGDGYLTNAAALLFVGRESPCLDYLRRGVSGGDSTQRVRRADRSLLEQLAEVFTVAAAHNPTRHLQTRLVAGQVRLVPERALREAIVNGVAHREWGVRDPTTVEHVGNTLRVSSPGGFVGGVNAGNIINHPSKSRNTALTELLARIGVAEREGIGIDRMMAEMLRFGHLPPEIEEAGPGVVTSLVGGPVDESWMSWLSGIGPDRVPDDLRLLMSLHLLIVRGWLDNATLVPHLQLSSIEVQDVLRSLANLTLSRSTVLAPVEGVPTDRPAAYSLASGARAALKAEDSQVGVRRSWPSREGIALTYARDRGRISSTELASLVDARTANVQRVLRNLEEQGQLEPSRPNRRGAGFYYRYVGDAA